MTPAAPPDDVLASYPALRGWTTTEPLPHGNEATSWLIQSPHGRFTLRRLPGGVSRERAYFIAIAQGHVAQTSKLAPPIIPNIDAQLVTFHHAQAFTVAEHVSGSCDAATVADPELCRRLGEALGTIHRDLRSLPAPPVVARPMRLNTADPATPIRLALSRHRTLTCGHREIRGILQAKLARATRLSRKRLAEYDALPQSLIHGDIHLGNIVIADGSVAAMIDFDLTRLAPPGYELVRGLLYCTRPNTTARHADDRIRAFITGYLTVSRPIARELDTMVGLFTTVQLLDVHGLDQCAHAADDLLRFGQQRYTLLDWIERHGAQITATAREIADTGSDRRASAGGADSASPSRHALLRSRPGWRGRG